jgi:curved DNA-binding protein
MEYKDYYKILSLSRNAKEDEIRRAYRKLAQKYHPDHNPGDKASEEKFKEINEAYQVLSDPQKRARYDQLGESYTRWQQRGAPSGGFNWDDWFTQSPSGGSGRVQVEDLDDLLGGGFSEFFRRIFGGMGDLGDFSQPRNRSHRTTVRQPAVEQDVWISLDEAYHGTTRKIEIASKRLEVKIPAGAKNGLKIRVPGAVDHAVGEKKSDLHLIIRISKDPRFEQKGDDLYTTIPIDLFSAVLGGEVTVPTLSGNVVLTIPAGTQPDQRFRLTGRGMPHLKDPAVFGDLFVQIQIKIPRNLTEKQRDLFKQLARS